jgi:hypothetical protein
MKKANIVVIVLFLMALGYLTSLSLASLIFDNVGVIDFLRVMIPMFFLIFFSAVAVYYVLDKYIWSEGQRVASGTKLFNKYSIGLIALAIAIGLGLSFSRIYEKNEAVRIEKERLNSMTETEKQKIVQEAINREEEKTKQEIAKIKEGNLKENRFRVAVALLKSVKTNLRDPESFSVEYVGVNEDATVACVEYRAKNGFGGMNKEFAVYAKNNISQTPESWNKYCRTNLYDMKHARLAL